MLSLKNNLHKLPLFNMVHISFCQHLGHCQMEIILNYIITWDHLTRLGYTYTRCKFMQDCMWPQLLEDFFFLSLLFSFSLQQQRNPQPHLFRKGPLIFLRRDPSLNSSHHLLDDGMGSILVCSHPGLMQGGSFMKISNMDRP